MLAGRPAADVVEAVTSAPLVSCASTLDCWAYVALNTATDTANEAVSAMTRRPRDSSRRCLDIEAATTPESPRAKGRLRCAMVPRPLLRAAFEMRHASIP